MDKIYSLNMGEVPRCAHAPADVTHTAYHDDGAHRWGPEQRKGNCWHRYTCQDCGLVMDVDSSD